MRHVSHLTNSINKFPHSPPPPLLQLWWMCLPANLNTPLPPAHPVAGTLSSSTSTSSSPSSYDNLVNNTDFITKILDNILTNTNLSDIINQIEPLQKENEALRALLHSQQMTLNELSALVMKMVSTGLVPHSDTGSGGDVNTNDANDGNVMNEVNGDHDGNDANDANGENDENEYENEDQNHISNMEYSVYIPEETGDGANNEEHGEHVEGYEETDNGTSWNS